MGFAEATRNNLRIIVDAYRQAKGTAEKPLSLSAVSRKIYGAGGFLKAFFDTSDPDQVQSVSIDKLDAMIEAIRADWPDGAEWPDCKPVLFPPPGRRRRENFPVESAAAR